jgi:hypothetical protein
MEDDYCFVEFAQLDEDGHRLSQADALLAKKANETAAKRKQILMLQEEMKVFVGPFNESHLLYRNWLTRNCKALKRTSHFDELPAFTGMCGACGRHEMHYNVHAIIRDGEVLWVCRSCDVVDNRDLVELRAAVDAHLNTLVSNIDADLLPLAQKLICIRDILKAASKLHSGEREGMEVPRISGHELFEWKLLEICPLPGFPEDTTERRTFCASMTAKDRVVLSRLVKQIERLHQRFFHSDIMGLVTDSVKMRNLHMQRRFEAIGKPHLFEKLLPDAAKALWDAQCGRCSSCGDDMRWSRLSYGSWWCPELDRTDVRLSTYVGNCSWMCRSCNSFKGSISDIRVYDQVLLDTLRRVLEWIHGGNEPERVDEMRDILLCEVDRQGGWDAHVKWLRR